LISICTFRFKSYNDAIEEDESSTFAAMKNVTESISKQASNLVSHLSTLSIGKKEMDDQSKKASTTPDPFIYRLTLDDLEHVCQLGMGGFGIVNLVKSKSNPNRVFALKKCSKEFVRTSHQEQHIINEKLVMQRVAGKHQFVVQLHRTFRDEKNVYFLMETAMGGELWTVLRQRWQHY